MIEPIAASYEEFPASAASAEGMKTIPMDEEAIFCRVIYRHPYCQRDGYPLHMHLILPAQHQKPEKRWPLLVYVQGSAWRKQELDLNLASLSWVARRGYAVAIAEYRPSDVAPFPAQIQDAKTAIRYLRKWFGED
ncbi:hypothetical protein [Cohnella massiliensis]|uniref:hypothetical protein n=1 Tax=Cohnella massiliensis TaxID=1816691 RepID=UPI0009B98F80|nr:hypothetical protein [Cohnella massiliensis]